MDRRKALLGALALTLLAPARAADKTTIIGGAAPDVEMTLISGDKIKLSDLKGQVVVLNFWATWCVPCKTELPLLDGYYVAQKEHGLRVFALTTEDSLTAFQLRKLFAVMHIAPVRRMKGGGYAPINNAVPSNFVIDRAGRIRYARAGAFDLDELNQVLVPLLREPPPG